MKRCCSVDKFVLHFYINNTKMIRLHKKCIHSSIKQMVYTEGHSQIMLELEFIFKK